MPVLSRDGASVSYLDQGKGPLVLLLHAFPLHGRMWQPQVAALMGELRLVAPDARGLGKSQPAPEVLTMETIAADALAVLDELGAPDAIVAGLSMGGYAAFELWRRAPRRVRALVLCDTRATEDSEEGRKGRAAFSDKARKSGMRWVADEMIGKLLSDGAPPPLRENVRRMILDNTVAGVVAAQAGLAARPDSRPDLAAIACPTLVMTGAKDALTPPSDGRAMAEGIAGARYVEVPGAGHLANLENATFFTAELLAFCRSLG